jgi:hypothetical protein
MAWLRDRPEEYEDLVKVDWRGRWLGSRDPGQIEVGSVVVEKTGETGALFEEDEVLVKSDNEEEEEEEQ